METKKTLAIQVPFKKAEQVRKYLAEKDLLRTDLQIRRDKTAVCIPVKTIPDSLDMKGVNIIEKEFIHYEKQLKMYKEVLSLPKTLQDELPTSFDIVGDIILIKIPKTLKTYKNEIGAALLTTHRNIRVVCSIDAVQGPLRTRNLEIIAGEHRTTTTHREYGLTFDVDVQNTYFSPRLGSERNHIASLVQPGEIVIDLFAGVAPFSIMIARYAKPKMTYALDKNKVAVNYAKENTRKNKVLDRVEILCADARDAPRIFQEKQVKADRIIMNLPLSAHLFFSSALRIAAPACTIHYYSILREEKVEERIGYLREIASERNMVLSSVERRKIKSYAPREFYMGMDIQARKLPM